MRNEVLKVNNIEKYYGNKSNITKAINNELYCRRRGVHWSNGSFR